MDQLVVKSIKPMFFKNRNNVLSNQANMQLTIIFNQSIGFYVSADLRAQATCGRSPLGLVVVTAADSAAAILAGLCAKSSITVTPPACPSTS